MWGRGSPWYRSLRWSLISDYEGDGNQSLVLFIMLDMMVMIVVLIVQILNRPICCRNEHIRCLQCLQTSAGENLKKQTNKITNLAEDLNSKCVWKCNLVNTKYEQGGVCVYIHSTPTVLCLGNEVSCIWQGNLVRGSRHPSYRHPRHLTPTYNTTQHLRHPTPTYPATPSKLTPH